MMVHWSMHTFVSNSLKMKSGYNQYQWYQGIEYKWEFTSYAQMISHINSKDFVITSVDEYEYLRSWKVIDKKMPQRISSEVYLTSEIVESNWNYLLNNSIALVIKNIKRKKRCISAEKNLYHRKACPPISQYYLYLHHCITFSDLLLNSCTP